MKSATIQVSPQILKSLAALAEAEEKTIEQVIAECIAKREKQRLDEEKREQFFEQVAEDFRRLRADPVAWAEYQHELALWDTTLMDGLKDETDWPDDY